MGFNIQNHRSCKVSIAANQSIATSGTPQALSFDTATWNPNLMWVVGSPTRVTCVRPGWYRVTATADFAASATGDRELFIRKNGTATAIYGRQSVKSTTVANSVTVDCMIFLNSVGTADYIEVLANQTSGGALNVVATTAGETPSVFVDLVIPSADPTGTFEGA